MWAGGTGGEPGGVSQMEPDPNLVAEPLSQDEMDRLDIADARAALREAEALGTMPLADLLRELGQVSDRDFNLGNKDFA